MAFVFQQFQQDDRADRVIKGDLVDDLGPGQISGGSIFLICGEISACLPDFIIQVITDGWITHDDVFIREDAGTGAESPFRCVDQKKHSGSKEPVCRVVTQALDP